MSIESLNIQLEFSGGAELLMKDKSKYRTINLPTDQSKKWTLHLLSQWIKDNLLAERSELFYMNDNVRPGILVLVNDTDWELLGEREYEINSGDKITYISTLHGG
uniref:Ubiquitin-related modifier 1 homolog n=1 Tax=Romanomermis culicivorax TaxID=13658 RepID=A0A915JR45_ROMCU